MGASESCDHSNTRKALLQLGSSLGVSLQAITGCNQRRGCRSPPPLGLATARPRSVDLTHSSGPWRSAKSPMRLGWLPRPRHVIARRLAPLTRLAHAGATFLD